MATITVYRGQAAASEQGCTVEEHLLKHAGLRPRSALKLAFRGGRVLVQGKPAARTRALRVGERIEVVALEQGEFFSAADAVAVPNAELDLDVALTTPELVVICKPAGQNAHPLRPTETDTALNALVARFPETAAPLRSGRPLEGGLLHRLDRGTSGLLACARTAEAWERLRGVWRWRGGEKNGGLEKIYLAWVTGHLSASGRFEVELGHDPRSSRRMVVVPSESRSKVQSQSAVGNQYSAGSLKGSWRAITSILPVTTRLLENHEPATLVLLRLHTGVMHQIRATLAFLGHPVLGDRVYPQKRFGLSEATAHRLSATTAPGRSDAPITPSMAPAPHSLARELDPPTERLLCAFQEKLDIGRDGPDPGALPENGFFLHALSLRAPSEPALASGVVAPPPAYFGARLRVGESRS